MNMRLARTKESGQSIPLIALMLVVLFGFVALSVDVGHTYADQRSLTRATNAATLVAMDELIRNGSDQKIANVIRESFASNGIDIVDTPDKVAVENQRYVRATYVDNQGGEMNSCTIGSCTVVPDNVRYIHIVSDGTVQTDFAKVVGQSTLPVNAQSWATRCPPISGVYPIAINAADVYVDNFRSATTSGAVPVLPPGYSVAADGAIEGNYSDENYPASAKKIYRRIFLNDTLPSLQNGYFSWLRWNSGSNTVDALAASLGGDGNLDDPAVPFGEAAWPTSVPDPKPTGYPLTPKQLTNGDWVFGNPGLPKAPNVGSAIWDHITKRTVMILPLVTRVAGSNGTLAFEATSLGSFYVVDVTKAGPTGKSGFVQKSATSAYMDLVYLGPAKDSACLQTNLVTDDETALFGLKANVRVLPSYRQGSKPNLPVAYTIVLDASGSMSQDFAGHATKGGTRPKEADVVGGTDYQCGTLAANPSDPIPYDATCQSGAGNAVWRRFTERRIYKAKNAINDFIGLMSQYDQMRFIAFSSGNTAIGSANAKVYSTWTSDKQALLGTIRDAGTYNNDPFWTAGGTPGAQALITAKNMLSQGDVPKFNAELQLPYKRVLIYITDGLANVNANGSQNQANDNCGDVLPANVRLSTPKCQTGYYDEPTNTKPRPIQAMIDTARDMRIADSELSIYTIALADASSAGLKAVANDDSMFFQATDPTAVSNILKNIFADVKEGDCTPNRATQYKTNIGPGNFAQVPGTEVLPSGTYGYVFIYAKGQTSPERKVPIIHDSTSGSLAINLPKEQGLPGGEYTLRAYVNYKTTPGVQGDGEVRIYRFIMPINTGVIDDGSLVREFEISGGNTLGQVVRLETIDLVYEPGLDVCTQ